MDMSRRTPSLREGLLEEHERIAGLLEGVIEAIGTGGDVRAAWETFEEALLAHLDAEDAQLLSALPRAEDRTSRALAEEHRHLRERTAELNARLDLHGLQGLLDVLQAHARNDERLLYHWAETALDAAQQNAILDRLAMRVGAKTNER